jgi:ABC-type bacteriocin/lantibiotic exporter with double-glycine peptidase domain
LKNIPKHSPKQVEFVAQRSKTDCGIACIAMLCRCLYDDIASIFYNNFKKTTRGGLYPKDISNLLEYMGYALCNLECLPNKGAALVAIWWKEPNVSGHYIVWDSKRMQFLDPLHGIINKNEILHLAEMENIWKIKKKRIK